MVDLHAIGSALPPDDRESWRLLRLAAQVPSSAARSQRHLAEPGPRPNAGGPVEGEPALPRLGPITQPLPPSLFHEPVLKVNWLEDQISAGLAALYKEQKKRVANLSRVVTNNGEASLFHAQYSGMQAEADFLRMRNTPHAADAAKTRAAIDAVTTLEGDIQSAVASFPVDEQESPHPGMLGPAALQSQIHTLISACRMHLPPESTLDSVEGLAELLMQLEVDCQAMTEALINCQDDPSANAPPERRILQMASKTASLPGSRTLLEQLEAENRLLREVLSSRKR